MKIEYLKLKNFEALQNTMNATEVEIDFSQMKNRMCLLIGPNGSGKTTILSMLHPFATIGNLDVRDKLNLITKNKEGYKEIHYSDNGSYYIIKHFYSPHKDKSHSVKSFIMKDDIELNENGNVSSFKEIVNIELGIDLDFMRLIRIGNNVTSMIDLSETERKNFMSKLLDKIGVFLLYYKKVNGDLIQLKEIISHDIDKMNRLGITDIADAKSDISSLETELMMKQKYYGDLSGQISVYEHEINSIENPSMLKSNLNDIQKKLSKMDRILERKDELESTDVNFYVERISKLEKKISSTQNEINTSAALIQNYLEQMDDACSSLRDIEIQYNKELESDKEIKRMKSELKQMVTTSMEIEKNIADFNPLYTKSEIENFIVFVRNSQQLLNKIYEYGEETVGKVIKLLRENKNVTHYINSHISYIDDDDETSLLLNSLCKKFDFKSENVINCELECEAKKLWIQISNLVKDREIIDKPKDVEFYKGMSSCYQIIISVLSDFSKYAILIDKFPEETKKMFRLERVYKSIESLKPIYNDKILNYLLTDVTEYDNYQKLNNEIDKLRDNLEKFKSVSHLDFISKQLDEKNLKISELNEKISSLKEHIRDLTEVLRNTRYDLETSNELKETFEKYDDLKVMEKQYSSDYIKYIDNMEASTRANIELQKTLANIETITNLIQDKKSAINQYNDIKKELKKYNKIYDEMTYTKESVYSKKGMPLHYMKRYLGNVEDITNELLDIAYDGKIYIDKFDISATAFAMPWFKNGKRIDDVKYASQGELSFLSVALSFALATQALKKTKEYMHSEKMYNIWLLDEPDSQLDTHNREKFIQILENQNDRIRCEQCFIITHNNMFSSYPIDIIDLSFGQDSSYYNSNYAYANYIKITRK